jgi:hypothetical protein
MKIFSTFAVGLAVVALPQQVAADDVPAYEMTAPAIEEFGDINSSFLEQDPEVGGPDGESGWFTGLANLWTTLGSLVKTDGDLMTMPKELWEYLKAASSGTDSRIPECLQPFALAPEGRLTADGPLHPAGEIVSVNKAAMTAWFAGMVAAGWTTNKLVRAIYNFRQNRSATPPAPTDEASDKKTGSWWGW